MIQQPPEWRYLGRSPLGDQQRWQLIDGGPDDWIDLPDRCLLIRDDSGPFGWVARYLQDWGGAVEVSVDADA